MQRSPRFKHFHQNINRMPIAFFRSLSGTTPSVGEEFWSKGGEATVLPLFRKLIRVSMPREISAGFHPVQQQTNSLFGCTCFLTNSQQRLSEKTDPLLPPVRLRFDLVVHYFFPAKSFDLIVVASQVCSWKSGQPAKKNVANKREKSSWKYG